MADQNVFTFQGKEFTLWTEGQLSAINREALKKRCLDVREHVGQDRLPSMPRHPEGMVTWMLEVQRMLMQGGAGGAPQSYDDSYVAQESRAPGRIGNTRGPLPNPRGGSDQASCEPSEASSCAPSEAQQAYLDAKREFAAIRHRNQGGTGAPW
eukprot:TRINITY_DN4551_c0_g1_i2.p1 TRINITY_DN4551_c0_g1~~TRINITY_DN4551_c0_g1_i2.p1  ORF type:complete len:173 (+),score=23.40 TRINITY_DN4551_c0_g1_i2:61-519(+)